MAGHSSLEQGQRHRRERSPSHSRSNSLSPYRSNRDRGRQRSRRAASYSSSDADSSSARNGRNNASEYRRQRQRRSSVESSDSQYSRDKDRSSRHKRSYTGKPSEETVRRTRSRSRSPARVPRSTGRDEAHRHPRHYRGRWSRSPVSRTTSHNYHRRRQSRSSHRDQTRSTSRDQPPAIRSRGPLTSQAEAFGDSREVSKPMEKEKPNFQPTGLLARETNTVSGTGIVLKYNEPPDSRKCSPSQDWRLYIFKGSSLIETVRLQPRSCWLVGREAAVADIAVEHPSCSKQHAVFQFRHTTKVNEFGDRSAKVRPYIIDLESSNGTLLNGEKIETTRFLELRNGDVVKFGLSQREYVMMLPPKDG